MKLDITQDALSKIARINAKPVATAEKRFSEARLRAKSLRAAMQDEGHHQVARLRRQIAGAMQPHLISWNDGSTGLRLGDAGKAAVQLRGFVIAVAPAATPLAAPQRITYASISFLLQDVTSAEGLHAAVRQIKAGADAIQAAGY